MGPPERCGQGEERRTGGDTRSHGKLQLCGDGQRKSGKLLLFLSRGGTAVFPEGAMAAFTCEEVMLDLQKQGVILGKKGKADVAEESRFAYKNIEDVMDNQTDLVVPVKRLKTIGVIKG